MTENGKGRNGVAPKKSPGKSSGPQPRKKGGRKDAKKSAAASMALTSVEVGDLAEMPHGGALRRGGNTTPGTGRPSNAFKARMREIAESQRLVGKQGGRSKKEVDYALDSYLQECIDGKHGTAAYFQAHDRVTDRAYGKVPNETRVAGSDEPLIIRVVFG